MAAAGSIFTTEAGHGAYLRAALGEVRFTQAFTNPLELIEMNTVASPFITPCPSNNGALPIKAPPSLLTSSVDAVRTGSHVQLIPGNGFNTSNSDINAACTTVNGPV